jgi:hypothetical protein
MRAFVCVPVELLRTRQVEDARVGMMRPLYAAAMSSIGWIIVSTDPQLAR